MSTPAPKSIEPAASLTERVQMKDVQDRIAALETSHRQLQNMYDELCERVNQMQQAQMRPA